MKYVVKCKICKQDTERAKRRKDAVCFECRKKANNKRALARYLQLKNNKVK